MRTHLTSPILSLLLLLPVAAGAQLHFEVTEINPDRSTLDAVNRNGASGGRVNGTAVTPDGQTLFAASEWGGLFRSDDFGETWSHIPSHVPTATWDVEVAPTDPLRIYATSFFDGRVDGVTGINVSFDGGISWFHPPSSEPPVGFCTTAARQQQPSAFGISVDPKVPRGVWVGTNCGLAISEDAGLTWRFVDPTPGDTGADDVTDVVAHNGGIIDVVGNDGHLRSTDGGATWTTAAPPARPLPGGLATIAVSPTESDVLFATSGLGVFESDDGGGDWSQALVNPDRVGRYPFVATNRRSSGGFDLWFGDVRLWRVRCVGNGPGRRCPANAWTDQTANAHFDAGSLLFHQTHVFDQTGLADPCPILFASDGGVYRNTTTGAGCQDPTWEQPTVTPHALWLWDLEAVRYGGASNPVVIGRRASTHDRYWILDDADDGFDTLHAEGDDWGEGNYTTAVATGDLDGDGRVEYVIGRRSSVHHRFWILDDETADFAVLHAGGNDWGEGNHATAVATGDVDGDGIDEVVLGRRSTVHTRYWVLDDANHGFETLHAGGESWGEGNYTTAVATGDVDGDGRDEILLGRHSDVNERFWVLDDAEHGFETLHAAGNDWGEGNYTTAVATGDLDGDGLDEVLLGRRSDVSRRFWVLDDAEHGFETLHAAGNDWGEGNYTTAVATGDLDGDGIDEILLGRRSSVHDRFWVLDDADHGFETLHAAGNDWGEGNYTTAVAAGDVDGDGLDEVVLGRRSSVSVRYWVLDDANRDFATLHAVGDTWGDGNYVTAVAVGSLSRDRVDLYFGNQDNGVFAAANGQEIRPAWWNRDCCDGFDVAASTTEVIWTVCCGLSTFHGVPVMLTRQGWQPPPGGVQRFQPRDTMAAFGRGSYAVVTGTGVFVTRDVATPTPAWTALGAASVPLPARGLQVAGSAANPTFFIQSPAGDLITPSTLWRFSGLAAAGAWQPVPPPTASAGAGFTTYGVDPLDPNRILGAWVDPAVSREARIVLTENGGSDWTFLPAADDALTLGGTFLPVVTHGAGRFTPPPSFYRQPTLTALSPEDPNLLVIGGADSGVHVSIDRGETWTLISDPLQPAVTGVPHIPRPKAAFLHHLPAPARTERVDLYLGTRGRGVFRVRLTYAR